MARVLAMILAFCALTGAGLAKARRLRDRAYLLDALRRCIRNLSLLMAYEQRTVAELLHAASLPAVEPLFDSIADSLREGRSAAVAWDAAWLRAREENAMFRSLDEETRTLLHGYFTELGRSDLESQKRRSELTLRQLDALAEKAAQETREKGRAYGTVGLLCGTAAVILML